MGPQPRTEEANLVSTAQDLPNRYGEPVSAAPALRLVPAAPLDFDDAVRRVRPRLHRYAIRRLGDAHEAEELVQEALLRAYTHRAQLRTEEDLAAWSTVVTGRLVIDRLRVRGRSVTVAEVPEGLRVGRDTADVVVARDEARTALEALDAMPVRQASLLWAREVEGKSYHELCAQFTMSEPAVRSILTRARKALRKEYALRGGTVPVGGLAVMAPWITGLTWAEKVRKLANRVTAPAVLGAAGIAALGGLVLSPYGTTTAPHPSTFHPRPAIVVGSQTVVAPIAGTVVPRPLVAPTSVPAAVGTRSTTVSAPSPVLPVLDRPLKTITDLPCTVVNKGLGILPLALGGSDCLRRTSRLSVAIPGAALTGYDQLGLESSDLDCSTLTMLLTLPASPLSCTQQAQP
jgi:RNA polymerase sigma-70 factor (ECF subfamily)